MSLGSGAAVPNIQATRAVEDTLEKAIHWDLYDVDPTALRYAAKMTTAASFRSSTFEFGRTLPQNHEDEPQFAGRSYIEARSRENGSLDMVDALGLWEYLDFKQAKAFLKMLYPKLKEEGSMIVSNMRTERPFPHYNQRAVGWPKLYMRTEAELIDIVEAAGINPMNVTITTPEDGVYAVMEIKKA